ncbi:hypothetical protein HGRIS_000974 [Hohenbuehelia grisea]|uniref:Fork-head domain-containing protein n=1 Tax=Hohenbuehelia grisea TaxID=104357 RepID=A0ABR3IQD6_9AGAR
MDPMTAGPYALLALQSLTLSNFDGIPMPRLNHRPSGEPSTDNNTSGGASNYVAQNIHAAPQHRFVYHTRHNTRNDALFTDYDEPFIPPRDNRHPSGYQTVPPEYLNTIPLYPEQNLYQTQLEYEPYLVGNMPMDQHDSRASRTRSTIPDHERPLPVLQRTVHGQFRNDMPALYPYDDQYDNMAPEIDSPEVSTATLQRDRFELSPAFPLSRPMQLGPNPHAHPNIPTPRYPDAADYLRAQLNIAPGETVNLWSLPDPPEGEKPSHPLPVLIKLAIHGSPRQKLTLQEIYKALEERFVWFRIHRKEQAWKNSIRHNLSLNKVFRNTPRPITEPGKGSYWELDVSGGEGYKRERKRRPKTTKKGRQSTDEDESDSNTYNSDPASPSATGSGTTPAPEDMMIDPQLRGLDASRSAAGGSGSSGAGGRYRSSTSSSRRSPYPPSSSQASTSLPSTSSRSRTQDPQVHTHPLTHTRHSSSESLASLSTASSASGVPPSNPLARPGPQFGQTSFPGPPQPPFGQPSLGMGMGMGTGVGARPVFGQSSFSAPMLSQRAGFPQTRAQTHPAPQMPAMHRGFSSGGAGNSPPVWVSSSSSGGAAASEAGSGSQGSGRVLEHSKSSVFRPGGDDGRARGSDHD